MENPNIKDTLRIIESLRSPESRVLIHNTFQLTLYYDYDYFLFILNIFFFTNFQNVYFKKNNLFCYIEVVCSNN